MKKYEWTPDKMDDDLGFNGKVILNIDPYVKRLERMKEMGISETDALESAGKLIKLVETYVESVKLTHRSGAKMESVDDLGYYQEGSAIINELGKVLITGIPLGNVLQPR